MSYAAIVLAFASAAASPDSAPVPVNPLDKLKCIRESVTGSLVTSRKVCHTMREWNRISGDAQEEARRVTQPGTPYQSN
jgi:hypothetical protein